MKRTSDVKINIFLKHEQGHQSCSFIATVYDASSFLNLASYNPLVIF